MVWVVIDNNETKNLPSSPTSGQWASIEGVSISPFVLAELFKHPPNRKYIKNLTQYPVRLGMSPGEVMHRIASLCQSQLVAFRPFHNLASEQIQAVLLDPPEEKMQEFVREATGHVKNGSDVLKSAKQAVHDALKLQGHNPYDYKFEGFADALHKLATGPENVLEVWLTQNVSEGGTRSVETDARELYASAMKNPYLRHHLHTFLWYQLSFQQVWADEYKDWNISIKKNDWTDMTLSLYTAPGDIILTADGVVRQAVSAVNPEGCVRTALATDLSETSS
jgi:hypothetical protein